MIVRRIEDQLVKALRRSASVVLTGPRQIGKTTIALQIADRVPSLYLDLEDPLDRAKVNDIKSFQRQNSGNLMILDEVQRTPEIFASIRGIIDQERRSGNKHGLFLFLGSASLELLKQSSESLAGRISNLELYPIDVLEYAIDSPDRLNQLWLRGGFPESLLSSSDESSQAWRKDFIRTYLERDIPQLGPRIPAETLNRFWTMLAHLQGTTLNHSQLARNLDISSPTVHSYLDLLVDLLLVRRLQPWTSNEGKRLVKSPKIYVRDSGITHALVNIADYNSLVSHPVAGGSWEGFVIENIFSVLPYYVRPYFYRSQAGAELDLVLEISNRETWAIEIKRNTVPTLNKGFHIAANDVRAKRKFVVYGGPDHFSMGSNTLAVSLRWMMEELLKI
jgi:predicted AAA+ superfamily ATPase